MVKVTDQLLRGDISDTVPEAVSRLPTRLYEIAGLGQGPTCHVASLSLIYRSDGAVFSCGCTGDCSIGMLAVSTFGTEGAWVRGESW